MVDMTERLLLENPTFDRNSRIYVLGYKLLPQYRGRGVMLRSVQAILRFYMTRNEVNIVMGECASFPMPALST